MATYRLNDDDLSQLERDLDWEHDQQRRRKMLAEHPAEAERQAIEKWVYLVTGFMAGEIESYQVRYEHRPDWYVVQVKVRDSEWEPEFIIEAEALENDEVPPQSETLGLTRFTEGYLKSINAVGGGYDLDMSYATVSIPVDYGLDPGQGRDYSIGSMGQMIARPQRGDHNVCIQIGHDDYKRLKPMLGKVVRLYQTTGGRVRIARGFE